MKNNIFFPVNRQKNIRLTDRKISGLQTENYFIWLTDR